MNQNTDNITKAIKIMIGFLGLLALLSWILFWAISPSETDDSNCEIYFNSNQIPLEALMEKVKESDENCSQYIVFGEGMDKYGEKWEKQGYYVLTDFEWNEMRKYQDINFYLRSNEPPIFHPSR